MLLEDAVRVVRRFKPQVVVAVFPPDERAGHGQHQASELIASKAYEKAGEADKKGDGSGGDGAGDPSDAGNGARADAFPELTAEGLPPWRPLAFYRAA